jgi:hypothetical protein
VSSGLPLWVILSVPCTGMCLPLYFRSDDEKNEIFLFDEPYHVLGDGHSIERSTKDDVVFASDFVFS